MELSIDQYLGGISSCIEEYDGENLAILLSLKDDHATNPKLQKSNMESSCRRHLLNPYNEMVMSHLKVCFSLAAKDFKNAYLHHVNSIQTFVKIFQSQKDENWILPLMYALILDLRTLANRVDNEEHSSRKERKRGEMLEKAADTIMSCFRVCASDGRASIEVSKKWGMQFLVNQLFKIYFKIGKLHLCKPLIRAIESNSIKDEFSLAQRVTYKFFVGRKAMFDSDYKLAEEYLSFAFENCHKDSFKNLRQILIYLIPVKMLLGFLPPSYILKNYNLSEFSGIATAMRTGNVQLLNKGLADHETFFIKTGVYLLLEKLRSITLRTLFKKVSEILNTHQVPLQAFLEALKLQGMEDIDMDETECLVAGLIYKGNIRGYISHHHKKLVVSKVKPFPPIAT